MTPLKAPFPWFGGKSRVAPLVWQRFGVVANYVEPFFGSGAVLLGNPTPAKAETVNDLDGMVANFWRATASDPDAVARFADWPVNENDLHARHAWLVLQKADLAARLEGNPDCFDAKIAGWWVWGICCWIGSGWCSGKGAWESVDGKLVTLGNVGMGVHRKRPDLGNAGQGVHRQRPHLGGRNVGFGINKKDADVKSWFSALRDRLRRVRVCCGDWSRITGPSPTTAHGLTGVFLDPPYDLDSREEIYAEEGSADVAAAAAEWAFEHGGDPLMRIALCGYHGEHDPPAGWTSERWKATGGYGSQGEGRGRENAEKETILFSPHCLDARQGRLF